LVRQTFPGASYASLEDPELRNWAQSDPRGFLDQHPTPAILDEIQRVPELLSYLQGRVDQHAGHGQYILTGSNQPLLGQAVSQSLAGRTSLLTLLPFSLEELGTSAPDRDLCLVKGFLPRIHHENQPWHQAYLDYLSTYVERDLRLLIQLKDLSKFEIFLRLLAGRVGQILNLSALANDIGVSSTTLGHWLSVLEASFVVFRLPPYFSNLGKRLVKNPKVYFTEPGLAAALLQIGTPQQASRDPLMGNLFENLVVVEILKALLNRGQPPHLSFYRDSQGHEVDLIREVERRPVPLEIKASQTYAPEMSRGLDWFTKNVPGTWPGCVVYGGSEVRTAPGVQVLSFSESARWVDEGTPGFDNDSQNK